MKGRSHGGKPALALWMLVAVADLVLLTAAAGTLVMLAIVALVAVLAGGVGAARLLLSRRVTAEPVEAVVRRRA